MCQTIFFLPCGRKNKRKSSAYGLYSVNTQKLQSCVTLLLTKFPGLAFKLFVRIRKVLPSRKSFYFIMQEVTYFIKPTLLQMMNRLEGARMDAKGTSEEVTAVLLGREDEVQMERQRPS